jgi:hypothetical protein
LVSAFLIASEKAGEGRKKATDVAKFLDKQSRQKESKLNVVKVQHFSPETIKENMTERH